MTDNTSPQDKPRREPPPPLSAFAHVREDRLRITDLDFNEHVNNAAITALFANARYDYFGTVLRPILPAGNKLVIGTLDVAFLGEMHYGMPVFTGTRVLSLGRTSLKLEQVIYQGERCATRATSVWVQIGGGSKKAEPWSDEVRALAATL